MDEFINLCINGKLNELKKYYSEYEKINIHYNEEEAFKKSCYFGHIEIVKWLFEKSQDTEIGLINIQWMVNVLFYIVAKGDI